MKTLQIVLVSLVAAMAFGQETPSPAEFLGYEPGARYTPHHRVVDYVRRVGELSPRVKVVEYGRTHEGRELLLAFISTAETIARLDEVRDDLARLADPRTVTGDADRAALLERTPACVWMSYCVHGNETSCTEAALAALHALAVGDAAPLLEKTLVILDPCLNPDGRDRYVNWFNSVVGVRGDPHPDTVEHKEPWPGGRYNHYYFDLNRDWAFMTQVETRSRIEEFVRWSPHVHVDYHEMGAESSYFFFPAERPINANFPPHTTKWGEVFGRGNAAAFDERGWDYYTAEDFDLFYPGYGDSWPSLHGAIGMTYEQAGHGRSGITYRRRDGDVLTLADRIAHHYTTSIATVRTAAEKRDELLRDYHEFRKSAIEEGRGGAVREYVLVPGNDHERAGRLVDLLITQGVEVRRATADFTARDITGFDGGRLPERRFVAGTYLVSLAQPTKRLIKTVLEPRTRIKELYFYDVSAWSLPFTHGVEAWASPSRIDVAAEAVAEAWRPDGAVAEGDSRYGYLLDWSTTGGVRATLALMSAGIKVRSATEPFTLAEREWRRGTIFVPRGGNGDDLDARVRQVAAESRVTFVPTATGMTEKGIDLGSGKMTRMLPPRLALLRGRGVYATSYGATRFVVEALYDVPHSNFDVADIGSADLDGYTAVVIPEGSPDFDEEARKTLRAFVRDGGVIVAFGDSVAALSRAGLTAISSAHPADEKKEPEPKGRTIDARDTDRRRKATPGSIFRVQLDPGHPLAFGYDDEIAAFQRGTRSFDPEVAGIPVGRFADAPPLSGYILEEAERRLRDRAYVMVERRGRGHVVAFAEDANFRSAWHGLTRLFLNAVLLLPRP